MRTATTFPVVARGVRVQASFRPIRQFAPSLWSRSLSHSLLHGTTRATTSSSSSSLLFVADRRWYTTEKINEDTEEVKVQEAIKKVVAENPCVLFMKGTPEQPQCGFSNATIKALNAVGANYEAFDVLQSPALRDGIKKFSDWPTIPQLFIGGEFVGGCDITIQHLRSGELTRLLKQAGALQEISGSQQK